MSPYPFSYSDSTASVRAVNRSIAFFAFLAVAASWVVALVSACGEDATVPGDASPAADAAVDRRGPATEDAAPEVDARAEASTCEITRAFKLECNIGSDAGDPLLCGADKFDAWCAANDKAINSESFRRAQALCLFKKNCNPSDRTDCEYRTYATAKPTASQKKVVAEYCKTCEPGDQAGCITRKTDYDPTLGPKSTDDVFVAAWELNDTLDDAITAACTGTALDAGVAASIDAGGDAAPCLKQFANCAGDIYINALPDCP